MRSRVLLWFVLVTCLQTSLFAAGVNAKTSLCVGIEKLLAAPEMKHSLQGIEIKSLDNGKVLYEKNANLLFVPASNFKLLVSSTALDVLGPEYSMTTSLYSAAKPDSGIVKGDLILVGGGDPTFGFTDLQKMADAVKSLGVKEVQGDVLADTSRFDDVRLCEGWECDSEPYYYEAQVSALNLNENYVDVFVKPGVKIGEPGNVSLDPQTNYLSVQNTSATLKSGSPKTLIVDRIPGRNVIRVSGGVPSDYQSKKPEESITVDDPALFACSTLHEMLRRNGIIVKGEAKRGRLPSGSQLIASVKSPKLSEMLKLLNKPSDNLIAECLLKTLGVEAEGNGTVEAGKKIELAFLKKVGIDPSSAGITDGSGLSRRNCITPSALVSMLTYMSHSKNSKVFLDSLPIAGVDGTLKKRMRNTVAQGNVRAKTGYLARTSCLSGFVKTKAGETLVFSIMFNNFLCPKEQALAVQDRIMVMLAGQTGRL